MLVETVSMSSLSVMLRRSAAFLYKSAIDTLLSSVSSNKRLVGICFMASS